GEANFPRNLGSDFGQYLSERQNKLKENRTRNKDMKPTSHLKSAVTHVKWNLCGMLLAGGLGLGLTSQIASGTGNPNPGVIPTARPSPRLELWRVGRAV